MLAYLGALKKEIANARNIFQERQLVSVYFGGGTPSLLEGTAINEVLSLFGACAEAEITVEVNPETATPDKLQSLHNAGVNRLSIGVQSFEENELRVLGRQHTREDLFRAIDAAARLFNNLSIDLMYECPEQTTESWERTLNTAVRLPVTHMSLYNLTIEEKTPFARRERELRKRMPSNTEGAEMLQRCIALLSDRGFAQYEISAFCKNGCISRHNIGYWQGREFLGFGPAAFSYFQRKRFQNVANCTAYIDAIESGVSPQAFLDEIADDARERELLILGLRCMAGVQLEKYRLSQETHDAIQRCKELGLLAQHEGWLKLTPQGILQYDFVAAEIV